MTVYGSRWLTFPSGPSLSSVQVSTDRSISSNFFQILLISISSNDELKLEIKLDHIKPLSKRLSKTFSEFSCRIFLVTFLGEIPFGARDRKVISKVSSSCLSASCNKVNGKPPHELCATVMTNSRNHEELQFSVFVKFLETYKLNFTWNLGSQGLTFWKNFQTLTTLAKSQKLTTSSVWHSIAIDSYNYSIYRICHHSSLTGLSCDRRANSISKFIKTFRHPPWGFLIRLHDQFCLSR